MFNCWTTDSRFANRPLKLAFESSVPLRWANHWLKFLPKVHWATVNFWSPPSIMKALLNFPQLPISFCHVKPRVIIPSLTVEPTTESLKSSSLFLFCHISPKVISCSSMKPQLQVWVLPICCLSWFGPILSQFELVQLSDNEYKA